MTEFENSITHCLTECNHCTGAYTDDRNLIILNCHCNCHKYNDRTEFEEINKQNPELSLQAECSDNRINRPKLPGVME